eukprot:CAMPEP_0116934156 /NCGR_PEP_ID=MMETSP0467-20121206/29474_1 /TAXON_ID=283647 /ORGANISM="Mesodinium pulex, Strain SPMC105" /LENGTH=121 /DNA_ID=CAMNT_0004615193 /DNA_START=222 /DNA_END=587 /DNA_ORIENTATION=-
MKAIKTAMAESSHGQYDEHIQMIDDLKNLFKIKKDCQEAEVRRMEQQLVEMEDLDLNAVCDECNHQLDHLNKFVGVRDTMLLEKDKLDKLRSRYGSGNGNTFKDDEGNDTGFRDDETLSLN